MPFTVGKPFYEAYKKINELYSLNPAGKDPLGYGWTQGKDMFVGNKAAMIAAGQWFWDELGDDISVDVKEDIGAFLLPLRKDKSEKYRTLIMAEVFLSIPKTSENQDEGKKFIEFVFANSDKIKKNENVILPDGTTKMQPLFEEALKVAEESGQIENVLNHGGGENFVKISNAIQFDVKAMGQEMLMGQDFDKYMENYNNKWSEARKKLNIK
jgi:raffinose/stachyose/melibiose transport system substrate-binding protein